MAVWERTGEGEGVRGLVALRFVDEPEATVDDPLLEKRSKNYLPSVKKYISKMSEYTVSQCNFLAIC